MTPLTTFGVLKEHPASVLKWNKSSLNVEVLHSKSGGGVACRRTQNCNVQYGTVQYGMVQYSTVQSSTVHMKLQLHTVLCCSLQLVGSFL